MNAFEVLPTRSSYSPEESVELEIRNLPEIGKVSLWNLGKCVARIVCESSGFVSLGSMPPGGYGVEVDAGAHFARTAFEVSTDSRQRLRYGFVADYSTNRELSGVTDNIRRLHLSGLLFYDWAFRHADLLGGGDEYRDALDQPISLDTVKALVSAVQSVGASALGYAAVYAVGPNEWNAWKHDALMTSSGVPYGLGDFLFVLDPASSDWLTHFTSELAESTIEIGFNGFHLDQFGHPKRAIRADGIEIDVAQSFGQMIESVRQKLPNSQLVFNNVNNFPTWVTAHSPQDAIYIEVWPPNVTLNSLATVVSQAKAVSGNRPVVIAAYQHVYDSASVQESDLATAFTMATLFSHGATQIFAGEADRILVDPYYVRNHKVENSTALLLRTWYDFLVEHDEILLDSNIVDVTGSYVGNYNDDCEVTFEQARVSEDAEAGFIWRQVKSNSDQLIIHLINLVGQDDTLWDSARNIPGNPGASFLRIRRVGNAIPRVRVASPDGTARLVDVSVVADGDHAVAALPLIKIWQIILIDFLHVIDESRLLD